jgi:CRISP-associated protein Cas1
MSTLYIDRQGSQLQTNNGVIHVTTPDQPAARRLPIKYVERVVLRADTQLSSKVLCDLADMGVSLIALGGRGGQKMAHLTGQAHNDARRRWQQVLVLSQATHCAQLARDIVHSKVKRQQQALSHIAHQRPDLRKPFFDGAQSLDSIINALNKARARDTLPLDSIRGLEGAAASAYFQAYFQAFAPALGANGRNRRPPRDPVNAILSLSYTMLYSQATTACWAAGLDPALGALHTLSHGRAALACDLMEPYRPVADLWVWSLFRQGLLRAEHFGRDGSGACLLGKAGRAHYYAEWEKVSGQYQRSLLRYARALAKAFNPVNSEDTWAHLNEAHANPDTNQA